MQGDKDREQCWRALTEQVTKEEDSKELARLVFRMGCLLDAIEIRMAELDSAGFKRKASLATYVKPYPARAYTARTDCETEE